MNQNQSNSSNLIWRPPYPSENLKTPRQHHQPPTYSTTNPYAEPEQSHQPQPQQPHQQEQHQYQEQEQPFQIQQSLAHHNDSQHSKRENNSNKIYERGLTPQVGMNPFLQGNYLQDLETQNEFLKPMNSNM